MKANTMHTTFTGRLLHRLAPTAIALLAVGGLASGTHAQTGGLSVTLFPSTVTVASLDHTAQNYTFVATLTNTLSTPLFLNGDDFRIDFPLSVDDTAFQNAFAYPTDANGDPLPQVPLAPNSAVTVPLFDVLIPADTTEGTYGGAFTIQGGANGNAYGLLSTSNFTVSSVRGAPAVPEPSSVCELGLGLAILGSYVARRRVAARV